MRKIKFTDDKDGIEKKLNDLVEYIEKIVDPYDQQTENAFLCSLSENLIHRIRETTPIELFSQMLPCILGGEIIESKIVDENNQEVKKH